MEAIEELLSNQSEQSYSEEEEAEEEAMDFEDEHVSEDISQMRLKNITKILFY